MGMRFMLRAALFAAILASPTAPGRAAETYRIDQTFGDIGFAVSHLGLFRSHGEFRRFEGELTIDEAHPEQTRIAVTIDTNSADMNWPEALAMLRSPAYFDVGRFPRARFTSTAVAPAGRDRYRVQGLLELRGVTQPVTLQAALTGRHPSPDGRAEIAEFVVTGELRRSAFGMVADRVFISDDVRLEIHARVRLEEGAGAG